MSSSKAFSASPKVAQRHALVPNKSALPRNGAKMAMGGGYAPVTAAGKDRSGLRRKAPPARSGKILFDKTYDIHDNGGRPFRVRVTKMENGGAQPFRATVYRIPPAHFADPRTPLELVYSTRAECVWPAITERKGSAGSEDGMNILIMKSPGRYVFVDRFVTALDWPGTQLTGLWATHGNSDVPYAWTRDTEGNYIMLTDGDVSESERSFDVMLDDALIDSADPYTRFYDHDFPSVLRCGGFGCGRFKDIKEMDELLWYHMQHEEEPLTRKSVTIIKQEEEGMEDGKEDGREDSWASMALLGTVTQWERGYGVADRRIPAVPSKGFVYLRDHRGGAARVALTPAVRAHFLETMPRAAILRDEYNGRVLVNPRGYGPGLEVKSLAKKHGMLEIVQGQDMVYSDDSDSDVEV